MNKSKLKKIKEDLLEEFKKQKKMKYAEFINSKSYYIIESSGLFDEEYYFTEYPDVKLCGYDPIEHYLGVGSTEYCNPNSDFNTNDYLFNNPDVARSDFNPFVHYILYGVHENRVVNNKKNNNHLKVSIIMTEIYDKNAISNAIGSVLNQTFKNFELLILDNNDEDFEDFINRKYKKFIRVQKIKYFKLIGKSNTYAKNLGIKKAKGELIAYLSSNTTWDEHYLECMINELYESSNHNCVYCNVQINDKINDKNYRIGEEYNRQKLLNENFIDLNGFIHEKNLYYVKGGFDDNLKYLENWDLVINYTENKNPHFVNKNLVYKIEDNKLNNPNLKSSEEKIKIKYWKEIYNEEYNSIRDNFDQMYYLENYPEVLTSGMSPICHYLVKGHDEGKNPHPNFVTSYYVNNNADVIRAGLNTFYHYVNWGDAEGRECNYYEKYNKILNNNLLHLSNYAFEIEPLVSILILNRNGVNHLKRLLKDFSEKTNYSNYEIIIVDNASDDESIEFLNSLTDLPITILVNDVNVSFAKGNNDAAKQAKGEYILLLNNDMEPTYGWLNEMMGTIIYNENVGVVGAKLIYPYISDKDTTHYSFTIQHSGDIFREKNEICVYKAHNKNKYFEDIFNESISNNEKCLLVTGAALLTKKSIYQELGGLDENYWYGYEDVDYNLRIYQAGYDTVFASAALLFHHESATRKRMSVIENHELLRDKWSKFLFGRLLKDKIENNKFFTDKALNFLYVVDENLNNNLELLNNLHELTDYFKKQGYETNIKLDTSTFDITDDVDIIISFTQKYEVKYVSARENIIKILILNDELLEDTESYNNWDIIITNETFKNTLEQQHKTFSTFYLDNFANLGKTIIESLYETFLKELN